MFLTFILKHTNLKLNIGDELYTHESGKGIFKYVVLGIREYDGATLYEVECQECRDHAKCRLLISQKDESTVFKYVSMINEDDEKPQYYWHSTAEYFLSRTQCIKDARIKAIAYHTKKAQELKDALDDRRKRIAELKALIEHSE
jgi:hypothetical protein